MAQEGPVDPKEEAVARFTAQADLTEKAMAALSAALKKEPDAIMIAYEADGKVGVTGVPYSYALLRGMSELAFDLLHPEVEGEEE